MDSADYESWKEVARIDRSFYRCFEQMDFAAMQELWLRDDRVRCIHPGGEVLLGYEQVMASWRMILGGSGHLRFELVDPSIEVVGNLGWASHVERIDSEGDDPEDPAGLSEAAATNLYLRTADGWRMLMHHASPIARRFFS